MWRLASAKSPEQHAAFSPDSLTEVTVTKVIWGAVPHLKILAINALAVV